MEDGSNGPLLDVEVSDHAKNGVVAPIMANFPDGMVAVSKDDQLNHTEAAKVNGDNTTDSNLFQDDSLSSEGNALVIDESVPKKQKTSRKKNIQKTKSSSKENVNKDSELVIHSNPYFNESLFELSQLHNKSHEETRETPVVNDTNVTSTEVKVDKNCKHKQKRGKGKTKPKLREYAQYLGLQPTVQFKCSKCGRAGFESLTTLHDHVIQCNSVQDVQEKSPENSCSGFKLTRKVFLCSACGTYYENWNLYMHMLEFHRRYICLYCLGMFSILEDLCQHIQSTHNLEPGHKNTLDEFFNVYNEPCYVMCCECNKLFSEQDNFFYHNCISNKNNSKSKKPVKTQITPENHITGDSAPTLEELPTNLDQESQNIKDTCETEKSDSETKNTDNNTVTMETSDSGKDLTSTEKNIEEKSQEEIEKNNEIKLDQYQMDKLSDNMVESQEATLTNCSTTEQNIPKDFCLESPTEESPAQNCMNESADKFEEGLDENFPEDLNAEMESPEPVETRKVPKLSLKLPKPGSYPEPAMEAEDSDDSEKLTMEVDQIESENENDNENENEAINVLNSEDQEELDEPELEDKIAPVNLDPQLPVAGADVTVIELQLEQPLDKFDPRALLQKCLKATVPTCIYCNHTRKIAVNGKELGLHCIAEHRYSAIVNSITAEELIPESFVNRIKECLEELELVFFNLDSNFSDEAVTFSHLFECFQCRFSTTVHKELYLHNRKFHSKNLLLCIMCKSNFYSYSELICHLCPGLYVLDYDLQFRCCMCVNDDLPSSFRLMVHLRKRHNVCDVCLEMCHTQNRLSNHVWKHKLHHFCYRCGIAYRNKPDITRHLFWKHGTESVLCKKCLQKKWPHVYHFCVPPASFTCDECNLTFTKAVSLKVHKRIHTNEKKHACTFEGCTEMFISKKLMLKHDRRHREPPEEVKPEEVINVEEVKNEEVEEANMEIVKEEEKVEEKPKPKIDVLDLPELNLSESDSSDSEVETNEKSPEVECKLEELKTTENLEKSCEMPAETDQEEVKMPAPTEECDNPNSVIQNIWDNFKNYQASKEKLDNLFTEVEKPDLTLDIPIPIIEELTAEVALRDHDYCFDPEKKTDTAIIEVKPALTMTESVDHDYCFPKIPPPTEEKSPEIKSEEVKEQKPDKKPTDSSSSGSSSDSDSSSCSCGSNCSCSSSSGSSSSTSDSSNSDSSTEEGRKKQQARRQRRKDKAKNSAKKVSKESESKVVDVVATELPPIVIETPIRESDLETTESETDEEFYDKAPQKLAKKILEEKRQQLLAIMGPNSVPNGSFIESTSRPPTPPAGVVEEEEEVKPKKKSKSKKRKKRKSERREQEGAIEYNTTTPNIPIPPYYQYHQPPTVAPITLSLSRNSPLPSQSATVAPLMPMCYPKSHAESGYARQDSSDSSLRTSKRRRVPNRFYGYSSDEDQDKVPSSLPKWRKIEVPQAPRSPMTVPPITIKTTPQPPPVQPTVEPISIRTGTHLSDFRVQRPRPKPAMPPIRLVSRNPEKDSATESNDSSSEEQSTTPKPHQPQLYCYCRCPYDEVSEMIGCDASDCAIEWFHFECVGIMVPPKGQWFCPDCRKRKQQRRELLHA